MSGRLAARVLLAGFPGSAGVPPWLADAIADGLGGVVLFAENTPDVASTRALVDALRARRPDGPGLVVAVDEEGGDVSRLEAATGSSLPGAAALGAVDDPDLTRACGAALGAVLAAAGVDLDLAPCLDVASEPRNPVIGVRAFGADPGLVARHGSAFAAGLAAAGIASCAKHFPGHGDTRVDSHVDLPVLGAPLATVLARDVAPFDALAGDVDAVMTAHVVVPEAGPAPASLSRWATRRLREAGFAGAIVTDALGMRAVTGEAGLGETCVRALEAGADLLCLDAPHQRDPRAAYDEATAAIEAALATGRLDAGELEASAARVARLVRRGPGQGAGSGAERERRGTGGVLLPSGSRASLEALRTLGRAAARRALGVAGDVRLRGAPLLVDVRGEASYAAGRHGAAFAVALSAAGAPVEVLRPDSPASEVIARVRGAAEVVFLTRRALGEPAERELLDAFTAARPDAVVVHTGTADSAPAAARLVLALGNGRANAEAVAAALTGATT